jgi:hypothetical protein
VLSTESHSQRPQFGGGPRGLRRILQACCRRAQRGRTAKEVALLRKELPARRAGGEAGRQAVGAARTLTCRPVVSCTRKSYEDGAFSGVGPWLKFERLFGSGNDPKNSASCGLFTVCIARRANFVDALLLLLNLPKPRLRQVLNSALHRIPVRIFFVSGCQQWPTLRSSRRS